MCGPLGVCVASVGAVRGEGCPPRLAPPCTPAPDGSPALCVAASDHETVRVDEGAPVCRPAVATGGVHTGSGLRANGGDCSPNYVCVGVGRGSTCNPPWIEAVGARLACRRLGSDAARLGAIG